MENRSLHTPPERDIPHPVPISAYDIVAYPRLRQNMRGLGGIAFKFAAQATDVDTQIFGLAAIFRAPDARKDLAGVHGALSDRVGRRLWYLIGCVFMLAFAFPYFMLMNSGSPALFVLAVILSLAFFHSWVYGPQAAMIAERFSTRSRYSGASLGYQLAAPFAGGLAPIIALLLLNGKTNLLALGLNGFVINIGLGSWQAVSIYMAILAIISFASVLGLREMTHADISSTEEDKVGSVLVLAGDD